jgi:hypothetical protein
MVGLSDPSLFALETEDLLLSVNDLVVSGDRWRGRGVMASSNVSYVVERYSLVPIANVRDATIT